ncbi:MAG: hypothetical protein IPK07_28025 [Deltaproteobacteria bacterium]|nr:hypothetical protein [Deltaproteobacteria bacterium]
MGDRGAADGDRRHDGGHGLDVPDPRATPAGAASDCDDAGKKKDEPTKLEKGCPIDSGAFQAPPVVEVPPPAPAAPAPAPAAAPSLDAAAQAESARRKLDEVLKSPGFRQVLDRQVHTQLEEIDAALHLTPEQKQKLSELFARQAQAGVAMGAAVLGGGDGAAGPDDVFAIQKEIENVLTPAQRRDYDAYKKAKAELARERQRDKEERSLVSSLGLDASQRDEVARLVSESGLEPAPAIGEVEREQLARTAPASAERSAAIAKLFEHDVEDPALTARLRAVLRPEQFARYEEYLARKRTQREQVKLMLGGGAAPAAAQP